MMVILINIFESHGIGNVGPILEIRKQRLKKLR